MEQQGEAALTLRLRADGKAARVYLDLARRLSAVPLDGLNSELQELRSHAMQSAAVVGVGGSIARVGISVLCDLWAQGWTFRVPDGQVLAKPPQTSFGSLDLEKARLRAAHLHARNAQLLKPAVRDFVLGMERRRLGPNGWTSVFSLMRDGRDLATKLRASAGEPRGPSREAMLRASIDPYIQVVESESICQLTGLRLVDIWRYFRYTWTTPFNTTPGRRVLLLVRDRAAENHPIIGIASLASAVVQHARRDEWIGWTGEQFVKRLIQNPDRKWARWLNQKLAQLIAAIYIKDFYTEGIITAAKIRDPTHKAIGRLGREAELAWRRHRMYPKAVEHKTVAKGGNTFWESQAQSHLFRAKRAATLASLLRARRILLDLGFETPTRAGLIRALNARDGRRAIEQIVRAVKSAHVGIDMLDITVCGAIAPYAPLLGGKLVSLLLTSTEVTQACERRYATAESVIASSMAGRAVRRGAKLVLFGTTSLYGVGSSQYNRLKVRAEDLGGETGELIWFEPLGRSAGYGSFHLSPDTVAEIETLIAQTRQNRRVNSIFGEGVSPRLRKVREGLELVGLPADRLLQHGSPRLIYAVALATNFRDVLLGVTRRPQYILPQTKPRETTDRIVAFWLRRWLSARIEREDTLKEVERHVLIHPIKHGARVSLPGVREGLPLFEAD